MKTVNERNITTDTTVIQRIIRSYYEKLYAIKMGNLEETDNPEEMNKFLEAYNLPTLNQKDTENLNRPIINKEFSSVIKNLPGTKKTGPNGFTKFYPTFKHKLMSNLFRLFPKNLTGGNTLKLI